MSRILSTLLFSGFILLGLPACDRDQGPAEETGEKIDEAIEDTQDRVEDTAEEVGDSLENAADSAEEKLDQLND